MNWTKKVARCVFWRDKNSVERSEGVTSSKNYVKRHQADGAWRFSNSFVFVLGDPEWKKKWKNYTSPGTFMRGIFYYSSKEIRATALIAPTLLYDPQYLLLARTRISMGWTKPQVPIYTDYKPYGKQCSSMHLKITSDVRYWWHWENVVSDLFFSSHSIKLDEYIINVYCD